MRSIWRRQNCRLWGVIMMGEWRCHYLGGLILCNGNCGEDLDLRIRKNPGCNGWIQRAVGGQRVRDEDVAAAVCLQRLRLKDFENSKLSTWAVLEGRLVWSGSHYMTNKVIRQREDMEDDIVTTLKSKKVICIVFLCLFMLLNSLVLHQQIPWGFITKMQNYLEIKAILRSIWRLEENELFRLTNWNIPAIP